MNHQVENHEVEIRIKDLFHIFMNHKILISTIVIFFSLISVISALLLPNIYTSSAVLSPSDQNISATNLGSYSSLAGLAGITLPGGSSKNSHQEAMKRMKTYDFFLNYNNCMKYNCSLFENFMCY